MYRSTGYCSARKTNPRALLSPLGVIDVGINYSRYASRKWARARRRRDLTMLAGVVVAAAISFKFRFSYICMVSGTSSCAGSCASAIRIATASLTCVSTSLCSSAISQVLG